MGRQADRIFRTCSEVKISIHNTRIHGKFGYLMVKVGASASEVRA